MSEAKKSNPSTTIRIAIIGALALVIGTLLYNYTSIFTTASPAPVTEAPGPKLPGMNSSKSSGQGTFRSSGSNTQQSLSGKPANENKTVAKGRVVDAGGQGVADAKVRCSNCKTSIAVVLTDENGYFNLPYYFDQSNDSQQMELMVSKGDQTKKFPTSVDNAGALTLQLN